MPIPLPLSQQNNYQSPPGSGSNDGAIPTTYDPAWTTYTNLTPAQISAFKAFPQDLLIYSAQRRFLAEFSGTTVTLGGITVGLTTDDRSKMLIGQIQQAVDKGIAPLPVPFIDGDGKVHPLDASGVAAVYGAVAGFVAQLFTAQANLISGINGATVTSRAQVDAAFAAIAPNSPSAKGTV